MLSDQDRIRLEKAFLGAALLTNNLAPAKTIRPEMLTSPKRQAILKAMLVAGARGEQFDAISLACDLSTGPEPAPKIGWLHSAKPVANPAPRAVLPSFRSVRIARQARARAATWAMKPLVYPM